MACSLPCPKYNPHCKCKYVYLDQGGELFNHSEVQNLFRKKDYDILPTGADNSSKTAQLNKYSALSQTLYAP